MSALTVTLFVIGLVILYASVALAWIAMKPGRHWLIAPCVVPIAGAIAYTLAGVPPAPPAIAVLAGIGFAALGTLGGNPFVSLVLSLATRGSVTLGVHGGILVMSPAPVREILRGGATIGYLERVALIGSVLAGQSGAVALIVAIKGLGRFAELENAAARERFIIGTLASLLWAGACTAAITLG